MIPAPLPHDEARRLAALRAYRILDTPAEERFERLVRLACRLFGVPIATVTFVDADRQWLKASRGVDFCESSRASSFCAHAILATEPLVIPDTHADARFADYPLVTTHGIRFYAGAPIRTREGAAVGVLCALDRAPRDFTASDCGLLQELAGIAADVLDLRQTNADLARAMAAERGAARSLERSEARLRSFLETASDWLWEVDADFRFTFHSRWPRALDGLPSPLGHRPWTFVGAEADAPEWREHRRQLERREAFRAFRYAVTADDGRTAHFEVNGSPIFEPDGRFAGYRGCGRDVTAEVEAVQETHALARRLATLEASNVIGICTGRGELITSANEAFLKTFGYDRADLEAGRIRRTAITPSDGEDAFQRVVSTLLGEGRCAAYEKDLQRKDGSTVACLVAPNLVDRKSLEWQALIQDISARKAAEHRALELGRRLEALRDANVIGIVAGVGEQITTANDEFLRIVGLSRAEFDTAPVSLRQLTPEAWHAQDMEVFQDLLAHGRCPPFETCLRRPDGTEVPVTVTAVMVDAAAGTWEALVENISRRKAAETKLAEYAYKDPLTGLWNRRSLNCRLAQLVAEGGAGRRGALIFVDLDHFKDVNDGLGHDAGDALLQEVAQRLGTCVRREDIVARFGGDEFAVILQGDRTRAEIANVAERMLTELQRPFVFNQREVHPGGSLGITCFPEDGVDVDHLLKNADIALYRAKAGGRRSFSFFDARMREEVVARLDLAADIRRALAGDEFGVVFQPVVAIADGRRRGFEALLRWNHPTRGELRPDVFLAVAEDAGLVEAIGSQVLAQVVDQMAVWTELTSAAPVVAVNAASAQLKNPAFAHALAALLAAHRIDPRQLEIEITENVLLTDNRQIRDTLKRLRAAGLSIALDDFGTGFASLTHLKRLPVDVLKIDKSFVAEIDTDTDSAVIARAIVNLAHSLNMRVVAEGIETPAQRDALRLLGCDFGQGYLFARPAPGDTFTKFYRDRAVAAADLP